MDDDGDFTVKQLVDDTIRNALNAAEPSENTVRENHDSSVSASAYSDSSYEEYQTDDDNFDVYSISKDEMGFDDECAGLELEEGDLARAHWIQLHRTKRQAVVIHAAFMHILSKYSHLRPIWQFAKNIRDNNDDWKGDLQQDFYFRHHCASLQAAITMVMQNKDDPEAMRRLLNEIGAHHFFYDAAEPHLEVFEEGMIEGMKAVLHGSNILDEDTEKSWRILLSTIKMHMSEGIAIQRNNYLSQCMTPHEIKMIREKWSLVEEFGLSQAGEILCNVAVNRQKNKLCCSSIRESSLQSFFQVITTYAQLLNAHHIKMPVPGVKRDRDTFKRFAELTAQALHVTINSHVDGEGFRNLREHLRDYVITCLVMDVCPTLVRKAVMQGLITMIQRVSKEKETSEQFIQMWSKLYRVLEQAMIANIVDY